MQIRSVNQCLPRRRAGRSHTSSLREADGARFRRELVFYCGDEFGVASFAFQGEKREDWIARFVFSHFVSDFLDYTGRVHSENKRKIADQFRQVTFANRHIDRVDRSCDDADKNFIVRWLRSRHVFKLHHFRSAVGMDHNGAHLRALRTRRAS
jgi:hypothetical protein